MKSLLITLLLLFGSNAGICPKGYYYTEEFGCEDCSGYCSGACEDYIGCTECDKNSYLRDGTCHRCDNCELGFCSNGTCSKCKYNYALMNGKCESMSDCTYESYSDGIGCYDCLFGHFGPTCKDCQPNCYKWNNREGCEICKNGYYIKEGICNSCGEGCSSCKNETGCEQCKENYVIINGQSQLKDSKCFEYDLINNTGCIQCENGYFIYDGGCINEFNCIEKVDGKYCVTCEDGYRLKNGLCQICSNNYFSYNNKCIYPFGCAEVKNGTGCTSCHRNYVLIEVKPYFCFSCCLHCFSCNNQGECTKCENGYYLNNEKCYGCGEGCLNCINSDNCTVCKDGFTNVDGLCQNDDCDVNCLFGHCSQSGSCFECNAGYYRKNYACVKCPEHCPNCDSDGFCSSCEDGYDLSADSKVCKKNINTYLYVFVGLTIFVIITLVVLVGSFTLLVILKNKKLGYKQTL